MEERQSNRDRKKYFILLEDSVGHEKKKKFGNFGAQKDINYQALRGDIFEKNRSKSNDNGLEFTFISIENPDRSIVCTEENLKCLKSREYNFLIAVAPKNERMRLLESNKLKEIMDIQIGDSVSVELGNRISAIGKVRYIGSLPGKIGHYFGISFEVSYFKIDLFINLFNRFNRKHLSRVSLKMCKFMFFLHASQTRNQWNESYEYHIQN